MRLQIVADDGVVHDLHEAVEFVNWYDVTEVQELIADIRHTIDILKEGTDESQG